MKIIFFILSFLIAVNITCAQDIHFSQSYDSPLLLNPAYAGKNEGYRFVCNYKNQWPTIGNSYKTVFAAIDFAPFGKKENQKSIFGTGLSFYNDKSGKSKLGTIEINLPVSCAIKINSYNSIALGLQCGFAQKSVTTGDLKWDNQFNGTNYDPNLASGEPALDNKVEYIDLTAGLLWTYAFDAEHKLSIGSSFFHLNKPNQSFSSVKDPLNPKIILNGKAEFKVGNKNTNLVPILLYTYQNKLSEADAGMLLKFDLGQNSKYTGLRKSSAFSIGSLYRIKDALILITNFNYKNAFSFGISYDVNISHLRNASKGAGGVELYISYTGLFQKNKTFTVNTN